MSTPLASRRPSPARALWNLVVHCQREVVRHRAEGMAAELTYRTIFSLIPVVVLGLVMFRVFGGLENVQTRVESQLFSFFGVPEIPDSYAQGSLRAGEQDLAKLFPDAASTLKAQATIRSTLHDVTAKIASIDFASVGAIGLLLFIYAAVALAESTEQVFNRIYQAPSKRPFLVRIAIHWSVITLGSGLLSMSLSLSGQMVDWLSTLGTGSLPLACLQRMLAILAGWVLMFLLYTLMPNTRVSLRAAAFGAAVGALFWEIAKWAFQSYVANAVPYSALYGSLGLIPLFLMWIYVTWLIVLIGLILTHTLQSAHGYPLGSDRHASEGFQVDPEWLVPILAEIAGTFAAGKTITTPALAARCGLADETIQPLVNALVQAGQVLRIPGQVGQQDGLALAKPADSISVAAVLTLAQSMRRTGAHHSWRCLQRLHQAAIVAAGNTTLNDLVAPPKD